MKKLNWKIMIMAFLCATMTGCSDSVDDDDDDDNDYDYTLLISTYVDDVVIPTYADMKNNAWTLYDKVIDYQASPTQANLEAVCHAWLDVRAPWELSESFLYGPCGENGLNVDPNIDTWPFDMIEFTSKINSNDPLTVQAVSFYPETTRGYHTIEYLIFKDGNPKNILSDPVSARELEYLVSATTVLRNDCIRIWAAWKGTSLISGRDQDAVNEMRSISYWDVDTYLTGLGVDSYSYTFKNVRRPYTSKANVVEEIIDGCRDIATEVSESKIESPYTERDITLVESHYAYNSLVDFENNIVGIRNAYFGSRNGTAATGSLASFVKSQPGGTAIDAEITASIENAIQKIRAITFPFALNLTDSANIEAAVEACADIDRAFLKIKTLM